MDHNPSRWHDNPAVEPASVKPKVFISYNHRNLEAAKRIRDTIASCGCDVTLIDQLLNVANDKELAEVLRRSLQRCDAIVVLLTKESLRSDWVGFERVLGDAGLKRIVYVYAGMRLLVALIKTHFLPSKVASFRVVNKLTAKRRYVKLDTPAWEQLVANHARRALDEKRGLRQALAQFLFSFGSLDQMIVNGLFNWCENRLILNPRSLLWKIAAAACMMLQFTFILCVILFLGMTVIFLVKIYSWVN